MSISLNEGVQLLLTKQVRPVLTVKLLLGIEEDGSRNHIQFRQNLDPDNRVAADARKLSIGDEIWWSASSFTQDSLNSSDPEDCGVAFYAQFSSLRAIEGSR